MYLKTALPLMVALYAAGVLASQALVQGQPAQQPLQAPSQGAPVRNPIPDTLTRISGGGLGAAKGKSASAASAQLDDASREKWERVPQLLAALGLEPGHRVADVGAGDGFYTERIAMRVGSSGRVRAVEISERSLAKLVERITRAGLANVEPMLGAIVDPRLESGAYDAILVYNSYHEFTQHAAMLRHFLVALKPGGRLVLVDPIHFKNRDLERHELVAIHEMSLAIVERELTAGGFVVRSRDESFIRFTSVEDPGGFWLLVATRPVAVTR